MASFMAWAPVEKIFSGPGFEQKAAKEAKIWEALSFLRFLLFNKLRRRDECPTKNPLKNQGWRAIRRRSRSAAWLEWLPPLAGRVLRGTPA